MSFERDSPWLDAALTSRGGDFEVCERADGTTDMGLAEGESLSIERAVDESISDRDRAIKCKHRVQEPLARYSSVAT